MASRPHSASPRSPHEILSQATTIAVVGASDSPIRPSRGVALALMAAGYTVIPVNPRHQQVHGLRCYPSVSAIGHPVDLVDVFRRAEDCAAVATDAVAAGAGALWLQLGIRSETARQIARDGGLDYVEDMCTAIELRRLTTAAD